MSTVLNRFSATKTALLLIGLTLSATVSVGQEEDRFPTGEWYVSPHNAIIPVWQPESEAGIEPQDWPPMVIYEVTRYPAEPTPEQRRAAEELIERSLTAVRRNGWMDFEKAQADGFEGMTTDQAHFANREFIADGQLRPQGRFVTDMHLEPHLVKALAEH